MKGPSLLKSTLAVLLASAIVTAQVRREPHVVVVLDGEGKPVAGASVTMFCSEPYDPGSEDIVRAATSDKGRAVVLLLPTRFYQGFAWREQDGKKYVTKLVARGPGVTELRFDEKATEAAEALVVSGLEPWRAHGKLRVELAIAGIGGLVPATELGEGNRIALPPLPDTDRTVKLFVDGRLVHDARVYGSTWELPPPQAVTVRVVDSAGKPVPGARLARVAWDNTESKELLGGESPASRHVCGEAGVDGSATLLVAEEHDPFDGVPAFPGIAIVASAPRTRESWSGFTEVAYSDLLPHPAGQRDHLTFTLAACGEPRLRVLTSAGAAQARLGWIMDLGVPSGQGSANLARDAVWQPIANDGWCLRPLPAGSARVRAIVVPRVVPPVAVEDPFRHLAEPRPLVLCPGALAGETLDLTEVTALRLAIQDVDRGPGRGAEVVCAHLFGPEHVAPAYAVHAVADATGRLVLPVLPGTWLVVVVLGDQWCRQRVEVLPHGEVESIVLQRMPFMTVRVVDAEQQPVVGAMFQSTGGSWSSQGDPEQSFLTSLAAAVRPRLLVQLRTDAQGLARLPVMPAQHIGTDFRSFHGALGSDRLSLRAAEEGEVVDITVK